MRPWIVFCEADADFRTTATLIDELLSLRGSEWVRDLMSQYPSSVRSWRQAPLGRSWFDVHSIYDIAKRLGVALSYGQFDGQRAAPGAKMLDTIFRIVRKLNATSPPEETTEALIVMWDMDKQSTARRAGLAQATKNSALIPGVRIVLACPDPIRETWILAGFDPKDEDEAKALREVHRELGFWPNEKPHQLTAENEQAPRHAKRVLYKSLKADSWERQQDCLRIPDEQRRQLLATRGAGCGLEEYLVAVERELLPLVDPSVRMT